MDREINKLCKKHAETPPEEELKKLLWEVPTAQIAKRYGVADHTVAKWAKAYKIDKPPRGYWAKKTVEKTISNNRKV